MLSTINNRPSAKLNRPEVEPKPEKDPAIKEIISNTSDEDDEELSSLSSDALDELHSDNDDSPRREFKSELDEDAINAPPASSSDEANDSDAPPKSPEVKKQTLDERLEADRKKSSSFTSRWSGSRGSQKRSFSARKGDVTRTSSNMADNDSDSDGPFSSFTQSSKRSRTKSYVKNKVPGPPRPNAYAVAPDKQSRGIKSNTGDEKAKKDDSSEEESKRNMAFRRPMEVDFDSQGKLKSEGEEPSDFKDPLFGSTSGSSVETITSSGFQVDTAATSPAVPGGPSPPSLCPWCKKEVDPALLMLFEAQPKRRLREQQKFCASHQQDTAEREWESRKYPTIDWDVFDERVQKHFSDLELLLVPDFPSYFRNILAESLKKGEAKNFRLTLAGDGLETISCGYYGTKGAAKM